MKFIAALQKVSEEYIGFVEGLPGAPHPKPPSPSYPYNLLS